MSALLIRLAGPLQSWGTQSSFSIRDTGFEPSKSGVIGLLCAALGRPRWEPVDDLAALRMGVRVDREGTMRVDYQTAGGSHARGASYGVVKADGKPGETVLSQRYYLADADFLVGLEGADEGLLDRVDAALAAPHWQISLGRKAFPPAVPVRLPQSAPRGPGRRDEPLGTALRSYPWFRDPGRPRERQPDRLRLLLEVGAAIGAEVRRDQPVGAAFQSRQFATRHVQTSFLELGNDVRVVEG